MPSDVRPPAILVDTLKYLIKSVIPQLPKSHPFLWDRTRSIRQDFTYQNYSGPEAIECNELIARIHLLCLHVMLSSDQDYSKQQELEQLNKTLQTLSELYDANRRENPNFRSPHEAEFRSYILLSHIKDPDIDRQIQILPADIFNDTQIQIAVLLRGLMQQAHAVQPKDMKENCPNLFVTIFEAISSPHVSFLSACLIESHFQDLRFSGLASMFRSYHSRGKPYFLSRLLKMLGFNNQQDTSAFCKAYGLTVVTDNDGELVVNVAPTSIKEQSTFPITMSPFVDVKKGSKSWSECIIENSSLSGVSRITNKQTPFQTLPLTTSRPASSLNSNISNNNDKLSLPTSSFTFDRNQSQNKKAFTFNTSNSLSDIPTPVSSFKPESKITSGTGAPSSQKFTFNSQPALPVFDKTEKLPESTIALPRYTYKVKDAEVEAKNIITDVVSEMLLDITSVAWRDVRQKRENDRELLIKNSSIQVFRHLIEDITKETIQFNFIALKHDEARLKKLAIKQINHAAAVAKGIQQERKRRQIEYENAANQIGRPRVFSNNIVTGKGHSQIKTLNFQQTYGQKLIGFQVEEQLAHDLWKPLKMSELLKPIFAQLKALEIRSTIRFVAFNRNWDSVVGKWLQNKLCLGKKYTSGKLQVSLGMLHNDSASYSDIGMVFITTGLNELGEKTSNINYDQEAIAAVSSRIHSQSDFNLNLFILDFSGMNDLYEKLGLEKYENIYKRITIISVENDTPKKILLALSNLKQFFDSSELSLSDKALNEIEIARDNELRLKLQKEKEEYEAMIKLKEEQDLKKYEELKTMRSLHMFGNRNGISRTLKRKYSPESILSSSSSSSSFTRSSSPKVKSDSVAKLKELILSVQNSHSS